MVSRWERVRGMRRLVEASGVLLAAIILSSLTSIYAQQSATPSDVRSTGTPKVTSTAAALADTRSTPVADYIVSPEDLLDVYVMDVPEITRTYRVSSNGFLTMPLLPEPIAAAGETLNQLQNLIATKFRDAGMLNNAHVTVSLKETRLHTVVVSGEVRRPQPYPVFGPTRLLDLLAQAGGLDNDAGYDAIIMRGDVGARADLAESARTGGVSPSAKGQSFTLNIQKLMTTGDEKTNILLYPGDRVTIQRAALIYVMGAVARPGGFVLNETNQQITVLKALAMAGDVTNVAKKKRVTLLRRDPASSGEKRQEILVDYKAMVKGQIADMRMKPDDILYVPESSGLKAWRTSISAVVSMVTMAGPGLMIYH